MNFGDRGAPDDGWLRGRHFDVVRDAGFDLVRWSAHLAGERVDPALFDRVDRAV
ncbi:MAG TPA: hypothetical protein VN213_13010 [Solirubrobacteraceae bacterium]|nr:hypothetical protein [Solirubrobacteraceae bacterium]